MNIFRELVEELKDENLLEETVIDPIIKEDNDEKRTEVPASVAQIGQNTGSEPAIPDYIHRSEVPDANNGHSFQNDEPNEVVTEEPPTTVYKKTDEPVFDSTAQNSFETNGHSVNGNGFEPQPSMDSLPTDESGAENTASSDPESSGEISSDATEDSDTPKERTPEEEKLFYRQRAMDEVTGLQLVEHVLTGIEREQMKASPKTFDDLAVKRSLHDFLKVADDTNSPEHAKAEFQLMQETENWASALSRRDRNISVAHVRRYCETTRPRLSSQALISLARFYRNSPYSEAVRSKFDLVFTKLFSKETSEDTRAVVFRNDALVKHIKELYADWSSIPLYATEEDDSELLLVALKFQEFISEADTAESFDELVRKDFFKRLKVFKEKTNENFFAPIVVAAAIESNVRVGNRYVELIEEERTRAAEAEISERYGVEHDDSISDATSKTLELLEILQSEKPEPKQAVEVVKPRKQRQKPQRADDVKVQKTSKITLAGSVNKWLVIATVLAAIITGWFFMQGNDTLADIETKGAGTASEFKVAGTILNDHVHSARISKETLFCVTRETWKEIPAADKRAILARALTLGANGKFSRIHFLNSQGKTVAFASGTEQTLY